MAAPLRLGLIGAGRWGRRFIATIGALPELSLAAVASRNPQTPALTGPGCRVLADWRELLSGGGLDAVIVAAPPAFHAEMTLAAVDAGLPVLVEKPLTLDAAQARTLLEECRRRRALAMVDHTQLFHPGYAALKARLPSLGRVLAVRSKGGARGPFRAGMPPLWDYGAHDVAFCLDLLGQPPASVAARRVRAESTPEGPGEDFELSLAFPSGVRAELTVGNLFARRTRLLEVACERGTLSLDDAPEGGEEPTLTLDESGAAPRPLPYAYRPPLTCAVEAFAAAVRAGSRDLSSLELGVGVVETLERLQNAL